MRRYGNTRFDGYGGPHLKESRAREKAKARSEVARAIGSADAQLVLEDMHSDAMMERKCGDANCEWCGE